MVKHLYSIINMENQVKIKKRTDKISYRRRKKSSNPKIINQLYAKQRMIL